MNNTYEYSGKKLTPKMARLLILELFRGETHHRQEMMRRVDEVHVERGGRLATGTVHPVVNALNWLKDKDLANNPNPGDGIWTIIGETNDNGDNGVRRIGTGNNSIYVYYYLVVFTFCEWLLVLLRNRRIRDTEHLIYRSASPPDDTVSTIQRNALSSFGVYTTLYHTCGVRCGFCVAV